MRQSAMTNDTNYEDIITGNGLYLNSRLAYKILVFIA